MRYCMWPKGKQFKNLTDFIMGYFYYEFDEEHVFYHQQVCVFCSQCVEVNKEKTK